MTRRAADDPAQRWRVHYRAEQRRSTRASRRGLSSRRVTLAQLSPVGPDDQLLSRHARSPPFTEDPVLSWHDMCRLRWRRLRSPSKKFPYGHQYDCHQPCRLPSRESSIRYSRLASSTRYRSHSIKSRTSRAATGRKPVSMRLTLLGEHSSRSACNVARHIVIPALARKERSSAPSSRRRISGPGDARPGVCWPARSCGCFAESSVDAPGRRGSSRQIVCATYLRPIGMARVPQGESHSSRGASQAPAWRPGDRSWIGKQLVR